MAFTSLASNAQVLPSTHRKTADGHFGRDDIEFPWERTDKAESLKSPAGL
jgi:S-adenosylmethionine synthetase